LRQPHESANGSAASDSDTIEEVYLVADKQLRANRNGNLYLQAELRDRSGSITARLWNANDAIFRTFDVGDFVWIRGKVQLFRALCRSS